MEGTALSPRDPGAALAHARGEFAVVLHGRETRRRDAAGEKRFGHHAGAGAELEDRKIAVRIDLRGHSACEAGARRRHGARGLGVRDQPRQEAELVGRAAHAFSLPFQNSLSFAMKPSDSGLVAVVLSASKALSNSFCFLLSLAGVSTTTST